MMPLLKVLDANTRAGSRPGPAGPPLGIGDGLSLDRIIGARQAASRDGLAPSGELSLCGERWLGVESGGLEDCDESRSRRDGGGDGKGSQSQLPGGGEPYSGARRLVKPAVDEVLPHQTGGDADHATTEQNGAALIADESRELTGAHTDGHQRVESPPSL